MASISLNFLLCFFAVSASVSGKARSCFGLGSFFRLANPDVVLIRKGKKNNSEFKIGYIWFV